MSNTIRKMIPAPFRKLYRKFFPRPVGHGWQGDYASWEEAKKQMTGYDAGTILEKVKSAVSKVRDGEAIYERDSVIFDEIQYSWPLLATLERAALEHEGRLCVLDFGGSLGSSYFQNRGFLKGVKQLTWCIVEQANYVDCGKREFATDQLKFYHTVEECMQEQKPNVLLMSSVLQYLEAPYDIIDKVLSLDIEYIILDRIALSDEQRDILSIQTVSGEYYASRLGHWFFAYDKILGKFTGKYELLASSGAFSEQDLTLNETTHCYFKILLLKKK